ncbi:hypothetical protein [Sphingomonas abietis]|uniref:Uncharacterized protein n=1 Tax=Sphingomonas abietis TaxID=3012344 RepID=A0ABY7NK24_9SPHN|nr:hypothetical protein [Sphingomonas abietis]WBO21602.1 hypothetical protein PBT88_15670 [Sphingomonas abietis]
MPPRRSSRTTRRSLDLRIRISTPLREIVDSGKVPAQRLLDRYHGEWAGNLDRIYDEMAY